MQQLETTFCQLFRCKRWSSTILRPGLPCPPYTTVNRDLVLSKCLFENVRGMAHTDILIGALASQEWGRLCMHAIGWLQFTYPPPGWCNLWTAPNWRDMFRARQSDIEVVTLPHSDQQCYVTINVINDYQCYVTSSSGVSAYEVIYHSTRSYQTTYFIQRHTHCLTIQGHHLFRP